MGVGTKAGHQRQAWETTSSAQRRWGFTSLQAAMGSVVVNYYDYDYFSRTLGKDKKRGRQRGWGGRHHEWGTESGPPGRKMVTFELGGGEEGQSRADWGSDLCRFSWREEWWSGEGAASRILTGLLFIQLSSLPASAPRHLVKDLSLQGLCNWEGARKEVGGKGGREETGLTLPMTTPGNWPSWATGQGAGRGGPRAGGWFWFGRPCIQGLRSFLGTAVVSLPTLPPPPHSPASPMAMG